MRHWTMVRDMTVGAAVCIAIGAALGTGQPGGGRPPGSPSPLPTSPLRPEVQATEALVTRDMSLTQARAAIDAAVRQADELKTKMDIAVVDAGGNLKAFVRMDGAWLGSIDIAERKARTARFFDMETGALGKLSQPGGPLYGIEHSNGGLITFPGGVPIRTADGTVIGAIGVSGSTVENDHTVAVAGAAAAVGGIAPKSR